VIIGCPKADGGSVRGIHRRPPSQYMRWRQRKCGPRDLATAISIQMIQRFASSRK
jgi:hypothetical protein